MASKIEVITIEESRRRVQREDHVAHRDSILLETSLQLREYVFRKWTGIFDSLSFRNIWYDLELCIYPTDVTNHYSGFPITT